MTELLFKQKIESMESEYAIRTESSNSLKELQLQVARMEGREEGRKEAKAQAPPVISPAPIPTPCLGSLAQSSILLPQHQQHLLSIQPGNWNIIYKASVHGATAANFHACCDHRGPTIVVVRSGTNVLGGFASMPWNSTTGYLNAPGSFLFSAMNPWTEGFRILPCSRPAQAMSCHVSSGPTFGGGHDLNLNGNLLSTNSSCNPGHSYTITSAYGNNCFVGSTRFLASEVEVFARVQYWQA